MPEVTLQEIENASLDSSELQEYLKLYFGPQHNWPLQKWDFFHLEVAAWFYNPEMSAAEAKLKQAEAAIETAKAFPNPLFGFNPAHDTHLAPGVSPWTVAGYLKFFITHLIHRPYQIKKAQDNFLAAGCNYMQIAWDIRSLVMENLIEVVYLEESVALFKKKLKFIQEMTALTQEQAAFGQISKREWRNAVSREYQIETQLENACQELEHAQIALSSSLGLSSHALKGKRMDFSMEPPSIADNFDSLRHLALTHRTDIWEALYRYSAAHATLDYELSKQIPDFHLGPSYQYDQGAHEWGIILDCPLPLFNFNQGPIAEALANRQSTAAAFLILQTLALEEVDMAIASYKASLSKQKKISAYADEVRKNFESTEILFNNGEAGRLELLSAALQNVDAQEKMMTAARTLQHTIARLEQVLQYPLRGDEWILCQK